MKKILILLTIILLATTTCSSQIISTDIKSDTIVYITTDQLKYANLIFVEHDKLLKENELFKQQIINSQMITDNLLLNDSIKSLQITNYRYTNDLYIKQINTLNQDLSKKNNAILYWKIGGITVSVGLILFILLK